MTIKLYSQQDNDSLMKMISQIEDPTLKALNSGPPMKLPATFKTTAFSIKSNKGGKWKIDKTPLAPTALTMASGKNFSDAYLLQLSAILYHDKEDPPMMHLIELMHLYEQIKAKGTIQVTSAVYVRRLPMIVFTLNQLFKSNIMVIESISTMVGNRLAPTPTDA